MIFILIAVGGFIGANARYIIGQLAKKYLNFSIPLGTLIINAIGSLLLGLLVGKGIRGDVYSFLGVGFMGAFTTFSTFKLELIQLWESKEYKAFVLYLLLSYGIGIVLASIGFLLA
ncbi:fluoride efflux transporter CrcB [Robertmurraya korlensis]|uniref:fluoride efflux transporter CrcB n=1 Tax=Robertmurraya korlensis TaxID=519977 RepID=UPI0020412682|nr:fluoride efflux transporter CrcB [Robertmurraya korlensis]MCM3601555.1 fluoride efflux transporter CrcB [Robertmurraya korlensis]